MLRDVLKERRFDVRWFIHSFLVYFWDSFFWYEFQRVCSDLGVLQLHMKCLPFLVGLFFVSQGGAMAALLAALVRSNLRLLPFNCPDVFSLEAGKTAPLSTLSDRRENTTSTFVCHLFIPFLSHLTSSSQFCIVISGYRLVDPIATPIFTPSYSTPTLHVLGKTDVVVTEERSRLLIDVSSNKRVEEHDGGRLSNSLLFQFILNC